MKSNKIKLIIFISIILFIFFLSLNIYTSYVKIKRTVEDSIGGQSLETAKSIAASIDIETYQQFLLNPEVNEHYREIRRYLNDAREKINALYVYTLAVDNPKVSNVMIVGTPEDSTETYPIGMVCTVPEKQVKRAYEGKTYVTKVIEDHDYGVKYLSVGAPIKDENDKVIGYLGIDISADTVSIIEERVLKNSISMVIFNGLFVLAMILSFLFMQRWYQKEAMKEVENTEDLYIKEIKTLMSSVSSLRHDFINHIQVLHGILKLGKPDHALEYVSNLFKEVHMLESIKLNTNHPGLSVLLQTKKLSAQNHNIDMEIEVSDDSFEEIKTTDLIKILSNLIDNAIDATTQLPEEERKITIYCNSAKNKYIFKVINTGPKIAAKEHIFKKGYSTKKATQGKEIRGQGLFIVKEVLSKYEGDILIDSTDLETTAFVEIPRMLDNSRKPPKK